MDTSHNEFQRVYDLWQHAKEELTRKSRELAFIKNHVGRDSSAFSKINANESPRTDVTSQLRERNSALERGLELSRIENNKWSQRYQVLSDEMELIREMQEAARRNATNNQQSELESMVASLTSEKESLITKSIIAIRNNDDEMALKELRGRQLEERIEKLVDALELNKSRADIHERKFMLENQERMKRENEIEELLGQLSSMQLQHETDTRMLSDYNESSMRIKMDHLMLDNARLVELLKSTTEYQDFGFNVSELTFSPQVSLNLPENHSFYSESKNRRDESKNKGSCHENCKSPRHDSRNPIQERILNDLVVTYGNHASHQQLDSKTENKLWIPKEAVRLTTGFQRIHAPQVHLQVFQTFLIELNEIWRERENRILQDSKKEINRQMEQFKRKTQNSIPYLAFMAKTKMARSESKYQKSGIKESFAGTAACLAEIQELSSQLKSAKEQLVMHSPQYPKNKTFEENPKTHFYEDATSILSAVFKCIRQIRKNEDTGNLMNTLESQLEDLDKCIFKHVSVAKSLPIHISDL